MNDIDLHIHSVYSDGDETPESIIDIANSLNLKTIAITDHDNYYAWLHSHKYAKEKNCHLVKAAEITAIWRGQIIHVLVYNFNEHSSITDFFHRANQQRFLRAQFISQKLANVVKDAFEKVQDLQLNKLVAPGRLHFAKILINEKKAKNIPQAFKLYLSNAQLKNVDTFFPKLDEVIEVFKNQNTILSLAHPCRYNLSFSAIDNLACDFKNLGGHSIEIINGIQKPDKTAFLKRVAIKHDLLESCGSDFHMQTSWQQIGRFSFLTDKTRLITNYL